MQQPASQRAEKPRRPLPTPPEAAPGRLKTLLEDRQVGIKLSILGFPEPVMKTFFIGHGAQLQRRRLQAKGAALYAIHGTPTAKISRQVERRLERKAAKKLAVQLQQEAIRNRRKKQAS